MSDLYLKMFLAEAQLFMDYEWYEEDCLSTIGNDGIPIYFIPVERFNEVAEDLGFEIINLI